jgi:hypothetical protein
MLFLWRGGPLFQVVEIVQTVQDVQTVEVVEIVKIVEFVYHRGQKSEIRDQLLPRPQTSDL